VLSDSFVASFNLIDDLFYQIRISFRLIKSQYLVSENNLLFFKLVKACDFPLFEGELIASIAVLHSKCFMRISLLDISLEGKILGNTLTFIDIQLFFTIEDSIPRSTTPDLEISFATKLISSEISSIAVKMT
jgi:hypothetical protein